MSSVSENVTNNSTLTEIIIQYFSNLLTILFNFLGLQTVTYPISTTILPEQQHILTEFKLPIFTEFLDWLAFDDFQYTLLKGFLVVFACNFLFICIAWSFYGQKISEKFMRPATSKAIQDLKKSVSQLKLPSEHTPRL